MCRPPTPNMIMMSSPSTPTTLHDPTSAAYKKAKKRYIKTTRNRPDNPESDWTPFRAAEKKFKARFPPPDLSNVLDLAMLDESRSEEIKLGGWRGSVNAVEHRKVPLLNCDEGSASSYQNAAVIFPNIPGTASFCHSLNT